MPTNTKAISICTIQWNWYSIIAMVACLALGTSARATMVEIPVSPTTLDQHDPLFIVSTNVTAAAVSFHITITNRASDIYPDSSVCVAIITRQKTPNGGLEISSKTVTPEIPVTVEKTPRVWNTTFTVPRELSKNPDAYFVYGVPAHTTVNGKTIAMPSLTCYQLKLQDFATP